MSRLGILIAVVGIATAPIVRAQDSAHRVKDGGRLFDRAAVDRVDAELGRLAKTYGVNVVIETISSLEGRRVDDEAKRRFEAAPGMDAYVLISKNEHRVSRVLLSPKVEAGLKADAGNEPREQLLAEFKRERYDDGLERYSRGLTRLIEVSLPRVAAGESPKEEIKRAAVDKESASALVERNRLRLTLAGAKKVQEAAEAKATEMKIKANIAIVDDGGHLLSFARMDGARPASASTAITKAVSAATFRRPSGPLGEVSNAAPDILLNLSIQNAASASGGKITTLPGGIPIIVDNQVIGAIGVGGGTGNQDVDVARAGIKALLDQLRPSE